MRNLKNFRLLTFFIFIMLGVILAPNILLANDDKDSSSSLGGGVIEGVSESANKSYMELYQYMISNGFSKECAAGVIGNSIAECGGNWDSKSPGGRYQGAFQIGDERLANCKSFCSKNGLDWKSAMGQFLYLESAELESGFGSYIASPSYEDWKTTNDYVVGFEGWMAAMERCVAMGGYKGNYSLQKVKTPSSYASRYGTSYQGGQQRKAATEKVLKAFAGVMPVDNAGSNLVDGPNNLTISAGTYYSEDALGRKIALTEENLADIYLDMVSEKLLKQYQLEAVVGWKRTIALREQEHGLTAIIRQVTIFIGFVLTLWSILMYLCYWVDKLNNFGFISFLSIITFGYLRTNADDFDTVINEKHTVRLVNHKAIIGISLVCMFFGLFILTGKFYICVNALINWVRALCNI